MGIRNVKVEEFGVFSKLSVSFSPGINVFLGANATGKSQLLKLLYALHKIAETSALGALDDKLLGVFRPDNLGRLVHRGVGRKRAVVKMELGNHSTIGFDLTTVDTLTPNATDPLEATAPCIFLPSRELLAIYEGFVALYESRELSFDETYYDTCKLLGLPALRGPRARAAAKLMAHIGSALGGGVSLEKGRFYVNRSEGGVRVDLEANLLSEGLRKVATLVRLIANGSLRDRSVLFWDEPEANMNPRLVRDMIVFLQGIASQGVQVFVATHDTLVCQRLSLPAEYGLKDRVPTRFFGLYRDAEDLVQVEHADTLADIEHNPIFEEFRTFREEEHAVLMKPQGAA